MLKDAFQSLQRNLPPVLAFLAAGFILMAAKVAFEYYVLESHGEEPKDATVQFLGFVSDLGFAAGIALAQSVFFSRLGAEIDRPYWKIDSTSDAIKQYFALWFILSLLGLAASRLVLQITAAAGPDAFLPLLMMWLILAAFLVPFGAAVMFHKRTGREEIKQALNVISSEIQHLLGPLALWYAITITVLAVLLTNPPPPLWARPFLALVELYADCLVFAATWHVCRQHRDKIPEDHDDWDF